MRCLYHPPHKHIIVCLLFFLLVACQQVPPADRDTNSFADQWRLTPQQRSELIAKKSALDLRHWKIVSRFNEAEEASTKAQLSLVARRLESGLASHDGFLAAQIQLSEDKIRRLQSSEQLRNLEDAFHNQGHGAGSSEDALYERVRSGLAGTPETEVFAVLESIPGKLSESERKDLFSSLWSRYQTSKSINRQCDIIDALTTSSIEINHEGFLSGLLSASEFAYVNREARKQKLECIQHRYESDNIEIELYVLLKPGLNGTEILGQQ